MYKAQLKDKIVLNPQSVSEWFVREVAITIPEMSSNPCFDFFPLRVERSTDGERRVGEPEGGGKMSETSASGFP